MEEILLTRARPSIRVVTEQVADEETIPIGSSKIGGRPDLPRGTDWIQTRHLQPNESLPFLAQINLAETAPYDVDNLLPPIGMLYFFGDPPYGRGEGRVIYFDSDLSTLARRGFPDDVEETARATGLTERYVPCRVQFISEWNLPNVVLGRTDLPETFEFFELLSEASYSISPDGRRASVNRLLGHSFGHGQDLHLSCQLAHEGFDVYRADENEIQTALAGKHAWQLLLQIDSDPNADMSWSDAGSVYFFIRSEDLKAQNFDRVCFEFESG